MVHITSWEGIVTNSNISHHGGPDHFLEGEVGPTAQGVGAHRAAVHRSRIGVREGMRDGGPQAQQHEAVQN